MGNICRWLLLNKFNTDSRRSHLCRPSHWCSRLHLSINSHSSCFCFFFVVFFFLFFFFFLLLLLFLLYIEDFYYLTGFTGRLHLFHPLNKSTVQCQEDSWPFSGRRIEAVSEGGGYLFPCSPEKKSTFSLVPKNQNLDFFIFLVPPNCLWSPSLISFRLWFHCSPEINDLIPLFP